MCASWHSYDAFFADMGEMPENLTLDRIDVNKGYSIGNCRWATREEQSCNKRDNVHLELHGVVMTLSQWARKLGIGTDTLHRRLRVYKMPAERALTAGSLQKHWEHGSIAGYEVHKCKCDKCRESNTIRHREYRKRKEGST